VAWSRHTGGGYPFDPVWADTRVAGFTHPLPPSPDAAGIKELRDLWTGAGLQSLETREIVVERKFADEDYWSTSTITPSVRPPLEAMTPEVLAQAKARVRARLPADAMGCVTYRARANAIKGRVPA
jgi:hypothetical protein